MKKIFLLAALALALGAGAQDKEKVQAAKGVIYGAVKEGKDAVAPDELKEKLADNQYEGLMKAKVVEVCQAEGCWIKVERKDGTAMLVRAKDHAFLMPSNIVGKTVLIDGSATVKETTEAQRRHYAEDAGKSKEEIAAIKGSEIAVEFSARGVKVLD
ncbi:MAG: DUF4920 domain-containing protein [Flavisolibacter sp.]